MAVRPPSKPRPRSRKRREDTKTTGVKKVDGSGTKKLDNTQTDLHIRSVVDEGSGPVPGKPAEVVIACQAELQRNPDRLRRARLHFEIARASEAITGGLDAAAENYSEALKLNADYLPAILGARRVYAALANFEAMLPLFDAEVRITPNARRKAMLLYEKGRVLEDNMGALERARSCYKDALALEGSNAVILKALERANIRARRWGELAEVLKRVANTVASDPRHRAAVIAERAQLVERHEDAGAAAELYANAWRLDPMVIGPDQALTRIFHRKGSWQHLLEVLEREASQTKDAELRSILLRRAARLYIDRLGDFGEGMKALAGAMQAAPNDPLILEELAYYYQDTEYFISLIAVLEKLIPTCQDVTERVSLLHTLGRLFDILARDDDAVLCYRRALEGDPTHIPTLRAIGRLFTRRADWKRLLEVHLGEAQATKDPKRCAEAHARAADILETKLNQPDAAAEHHARALLRWPSYPSSFKALARLHSTAGRYRELIELYERALDDAREDAQKIALLFQVAALWENQLGDPRKAAFSFRRVLDVDPSNLVAVHGLQRVHERAGRYQELVAALEFEADLTNDDELVVSLLHRAGVVLDEHRGDQDGALARFRRVLEISPAFGPALSSLGRIYFRTGRWEELLDIYQRELLVTAPGRPAAVLLHKMGELCEQRIGRDDAAVDFYVKAIDEDEAYRPALQSLAARQRENSDWKGLIATLEQETRCVGDAETRAQVWFKIGEVHELRLEDLDKAREAYEKSMVEVARFRPAVTALARLRAEARLWPDLVTELEGEVQATVDPRRKAALLIRSGQILRDEIGDQERAIASYENAIRQHASGQLSALMALERIYTEQDDRHGLAGTYSMQAEQLRDGKARTAALHELARALEQLGTGDFINLIAAYEGILEVIPDDLFTLLKLEEVARTAGDRKLMVRLYSRLSELADDPAMSAEYLTRLAETLEKSGDLQALAVYRQALDKDPNQLAAVFGMARLADVARDPRSVADAAQLHSRLTGDPEMAAQLLVKSASVKLDDLGDAEDAVRDLEKALELWPDDVNAVQLLITALQQMERLDDLIDLLGRAAQSARSKIRTAELWLEVADLYGDTVGDSGAAIAALRRGLAAKRDHVPSLLRLADFHRLEKQWMDAVKTFEKVLEASEDLEIQSDARLQMADLWDEQLERPERAMEQVSAILAKTPEHAAALYKLASLESRDGKPDAAIMTLQRLIKLQAEPADRATSLLRIAEVERGRQDDKAADEALVEAISLEGQNGAAATALRKVSKKAGTWVSYAAGLAGYIQNVKSGDVPRPGADEWARTFRELANTYDAGMGLPKKAIETLRDGLGATGEEASLLLALAARLRKTGDYSEAIRRLRKLLIREVVKTEAWEELARAFQEAGRAQEAQHALMPLLVLGNATSEVSEALSRRRARPGSAAAGSFDASLIASVALERATSIPAAELLSSVAEASGKMYPPEIEAFGLSKRDRISSRSGHPLRDLAERIALIFSVDSFDFYLHTHREPLVSIELTEPPSIMVASSVQRLPQTQQAFLLAYAMSAIACRFYPALRLRDKEIELLLAASARAHVEGVSTSFTDDETLNEHGQRLKRYVPRRWRRPMELASVEYASTRININRWRQALLQTATRVGMVISDDLAGTVKVLQRLHSLSRLEGAELFERSPALADLLRFWGSDEAMALRRHIGML